MQKILTGEVMEKKTIPEIVDASLSVFGMIWDWTAGHDIWRVFLFLIVCAVVLFFALSILLNAAGKAFEGGAKLLNSLGGSGFSRIMNRDENLRIRKRTQFCSVLEADLTSIAKAESWNDQYFTDLEAEVETEGGYYKSRLHRLFGRSSNGLRKEKSLIGAISSSSERAIQLTGEPGSGKSVALRHLASQLAMRAKLSKRKDVVIPLYINLREIDVPVGLPINSDAIRDFILDNIRRGDSDTAAYVRENWSDYRQRGVWFFLFDSFDEIPAILHAEKGSPVTKKYSEAIRMFLEGMGECRGILASREFKGPESLPWKKFRILRLSYDKQRDLISNAFLSPEQEKIALHHIAANQSTVASTPLFLTLLCRYVKDFDCAPVNDYELLSLQIDRLARRDPYYLKRLYDLTPEELLDGAQRIARLFAEEPSLGLAPTVDQVMALLTSSEIPGADVQRFVAAMVDSKIARADVPNAIPGDRRFAFSHRRYQEALFVRHLVENPGYLSGHELMTDPRWREYAVTLLETQPVEALGEMFEVAEGILKAAASSQVLTDAVEPLAGHCGYFNWDEEASLVLNLLQEGLVRRVGLIPSSLSEQVYGFLGMRWEDGDTFDRVCVMRVASLLPQHILEKFLEETFLIGSQNSQYEAFKQTASLVGVVSATVKKAVLNHLSEEILSARDSSAILRVEALIARLPEDFGAWHVLRRCELIWRFATVIDGIFGISLVLRLVGSIFFPDRRVGSNGSFRVLLTLAFGSMLFLYFVMMVLLGLKFGLKSSDALQGAIDVFMADPSGFLGQAQVGFLKNPLRSIGVTLVLFLPLYFPLIYKFRSVGEAVGFSYFWSRIFRPKSSLRAIYELLVILMSVVMVFGFVFGVGAASSFVANYVFGLSVRLHELPLGLFVSFIFGICLVFSFRVKWLLVRKFSRGEFDSLAQLGTERGFGLVLQSDGWEQFSNRLSFWIEGMNENDVGEMVKGEVRSISAILQAACRGELHRVACAPFLMSKPQFSLIFRAIDEVERSIVGEAILKDQTLIGD